MAFQQCALKSGALQWLILHKGEVHIIRQYSQDTIWVQQSTADITGRRRRRFCGNQRQSEWQTGIMRLPPGNIKVSRASTLSTRGQSERHEKKKSMPAWSPFRNQLPPSDLLSASSHLFFVSHGRLFQGIHGVVGCKVARKTRAELCIFPPASSASSLLDNNTGCC